MGDQIYSPVMQVFKDDGDPGAGYLLYTYEAGTTTPKTVYTDEACTVPATNPVVFDSRGEATIYYADEYKFVLKTDADVTIWTVDSVGTAPTSEEVTYSYYPDPDESDQGVTASGTGDTIYDIITALSTTKYAKIVLRKNSDDATVTEYTFDTSLDLTSYPNVQIEIQPGARLARTTGDETFTVHSPGCIIAAKDQILTLVGVLAFYRPGTIYPEWYGAVHDGTTDDGAEIRNALAGAANGSKIKFLHGTYAITGTTGLPITSPIHLEMNEGSKFLFSDDDTVYVYANGVTGATFDNLTVDAGTPSVRGTRAALHLDDCNETRTRGLKVLSSAGAGYFVSGGTNNSIADSSATDTLADGFHWTGATTLFSGSNLLSESTGDDGFAVVSYLSDGDMCADGNLTGLVSRNSVANAFKISGGKRIRADVVGYNTGAHGMTICEDAAFSTYETESCQVSGVIDTTTLLGVNMVKDCNDIDLNVVIKDAGTDGVYIGSSGSTIENITLNGEIIGSGASGVQVNNASNVSIGSVSVLENTNYGIAFVNVTNLSVGSIFAYNNNTGADGVKDNVYLQSVSYASIGSINAVDDRTPKLVHRAFEGLTLTGVSIGSLRYSGSLDLTNPVNIAQSGTTDVRINTHLGVAKSFGPNDATPSVVGYTSFLTTNTAATTITDFDDGFIGQDIVVIIGDANTTIDFTSSALIGNAGADWSPGSGDWLRAYYNGTNWYCTITEI